MFSIWACIFDAEKKFPSQWMTTCLEMTEFIEWV